MAYQKYQKPQKIGGIIDPKDIRNQPTTLQELVISVLNQFFYITPMVLRSPKEDDWMVLEAFLTGLNSMLEPYLDAWTPRYQEEMEKLKVKLDDPAQIYANKRKFIKVIYGEFMGTIIREFGNPDIALLPVPKKTVVMGE